MVKKPNITMKYQEYKKFKRKGKKGYKNFLSRRKKIKSKRYKILIRNLSGNKVVVKKKVFKKKNKKT